MFMTDDAIPKDKYMVENLIKAFDDPIVTAAYGRQMADPEKNYIEYYTRIFNYPLESRVKTKEDLDTLGIKTFFCSKYAVLIEDQSMMQWEVSSIKQSLTRT